MLVGYLVHNAYAKLCVLFGDRRYYLVYIGWFEVQLRCLCCCFAILQKACIDYHFFYKLSFVCDTTVQYCLHTRIQEAQLS